MDKRKVGHILAIFGCLCIYQMWKLIGVICIGFIATRDTIDVSMLGIISFFSLTSLAMIAYLMIKQAKTHIKALKRL